MTRFQQFLRERRYLGNISERSIEWYSLAFKWLPNEAPDEPALKECIIRMREGGLKPRSVNSYITAINSYLHWAGGSDRKCGAGCSHLHLSKLKAEQKILPTYSSTDIGAFVHWKPKTRCERRLQVIVLALADTGCRISELLGLRWQDVNLDDLLVTVTGKGDKTRTIPFSLELRKRLCKMDQKHQLVFCTSDGGALMRRNVLRDVKLLCKKLNIKVPERSLHALRHSFALNYIRKSGSPFLLQRALGHTTLDMTRKYVSLNTQDLQNVHQQISLLSR
jgi:integrase/recombinase XerD